MRVYLISYIINKIKFYIKLLKLWIIKPQFNTTN